MNINTKYFCYVFLAVALIMLHAVSIAQNATCQSDQMISYTTTASKEQLFEVKTVSFDKMVDATNLICLNPNVTFQSMDGFGAAITGSTCYNLLKMRPEDRKNILTETFALLHNESPCKSHQAECRAN